MQAWPLLRRAAAEFVATLLLLAAVVGSGIMADKLAPSVPALALLCNTVATAATLLALILAFGAMSGAQMNPLVTIAMARRGKQAWHDVPAYVAAQIAGGLCGTLLAHGIYGLPLLQKASHVRSGYDQWLSEAVATFALLIVIFGCERGGATRAQFAAAVAAIIAGAHWFTASTSFANPAVTLARSITDTFAGIRPTDVLGFVAAQCLGAALAIVFDRWFFGATSREPA